MGDRLIFDIVNELNLGIVIGNPKRVSGGYMHKMYQVKTTTGVYAVKLLNPIIMKRPDAFQNFQRAENLEKVLQEHLIPIVPAMEINGHKMQCVAQQYFYVFQWVNGKVLKWEEIKREHCETAGTLLSRIHKIEQVKKPFMTVGISENWDMYIEKSGIECPEIAEEMKEYRDLLYLAQKEYNAALKNVPAVTCICDSDMDSKNILWVGEKPFIIDLECLDYGNPFTEMFQLALSWSGGVLNSINYEFLETFIRSYNRGYGGVNLNWRMLYGIGFSWLEWLAYNVKRALLIECEDEEERRLGIDQVHETIQHIVYYHSIKRDLLEYLSTIFL